MLCKRRGAPIARKVTRTKACTTGTFLIGVCGDNILRLNQSVVQTSYGKYIKQRQSEQVYITQLYNHLSIL